MNRGHAGSDMRGSRALLVETDSSIHGAHVLTNGAPRSSSRRGWREESVGCCDPGSEMDVRGPRSRRGSLARLRIRACRICLGPSAIYRSRGAWGTLMQG